MKNMSNYMTIQQVANKLGVSTKTLRRWEENKFLVPDERQENTEARLYHSHRIGYWKKLLDLRRSLKLHLKALDGIKKALDEHAAEQNYIPGKPLKLLTQEDLRQFTKARQDEEKWGKEFEALIGELSEYPLDMRKATSNVEEE